MIGLLNSAKTATTGHDVAWTPAVLTAVIAGAVALASWALNAIVSAVRDDRARRRDAFSKAFAATVAYAEFPYVVRRRNPRNNVDERFRISEGLRLIQQDIAYYEAWLLGESREVGLAYVGLVAATRQIAGMAIHDAWLQQPIQSDSEMNMPDLGLGALWNPRQRYLRSVAKNLRPIRALLERSTDTIPTAAGNNR